MKWPGLRATVLPRVIASRRVELPLGRVLDIAVVDDSDGRTDVWARCRNAQGLLVAQFRTKPSALRMVAAALTALADELGVAP